VCPSDEGELQLTDPHSFQDEIESGALECSACRRRYSVVRGIPRFVEEENYAASFGQQWNRHRAVQLDSRNGSDFSRQRFYGITGWSSPTLQNKLVLDVGCGAGRFAEVALSDGAEVVALDLSSAVDAAYENLGKHPKFHCVQASIYDLPFREATFDFAYCIGVIQHTPQPEQAILSILPKVKRGGEVGFWIYELDWKAFVGTLGFKYLLRPITRRLSYERVTAFSSMLESLFWPLVRWARQSGLAGKIMMRMLPVSCAHLHGVPLNESDFREWVMLDTLDMYSPAHDHPQTFAGVKEWLKDAGFKVDPRHPHGGISITAKRLR
jgi:2-polyprenyl-3-methyl-5-hydroxy-6-metoxy-1,4-benzoquinol methylase